MTFRQLQPMSELSLSAAGGLWTPVPMEMRRAGWAEGKWGLKYTFPRALFFLPPHCFHGNGSLNATPPQSLESSHSWVSTSSWAWNRHTVDLVASPLPVCGQPWLQIHSTGSALHTERFSSTKSVQYYLFLQNASSLRFTLIVRYISVLCVLSV